MDLTGYTSIKDSYPDKGKHIIGINEIESAITPVEHKLHRCMCESSSCFKWKDSNTGHETLLDITHWKYI